MEILRPDSPFSCWLSLTLLGGFSGVLTEVTKSYLTVSIVGTKRNGTGSAYLSFFVIHVNKSQWLPGAIFIPADIWAWLILSVLISPTPTGASNSVLCVRMPAPDIQIREIIIEATV